LRIQLVAALLLLVNSGVAALEAKAPKIAAATVDWDLARSDLNGSEAVRRLSASAHAAGPRSDLLAHLNRLSGMAYPNIAASSVPVLLPFDLEAFLRNKKGEEADYRMGFGAPKFFLAGPAGYNTVFLIPLKTGDKTREVEISLSGFGLLYELDERVGGEDKPLAGLSADFPAIRRFYFESHMRYLFARYGVLYEVSVECFDGSLRSGKRLSCQDAHSVVVPFLRALNLAGGTPQPIVVAEAKPETRRPQQQSATFSYYPPGHLISGTSARRRGGDADETVYADIRFPLADGPAQTYSQLYINLGDCTSATGDSRTVRRNGGPFRCVPGKQVAEAEMPRGGQNLYPWRDSFCETRAFYVGQCPSGFGHQGQDIVPVGCALTRRDGEDCDRGHHRVVAVHDGLVLRAQREEGLVIAVNAPGQHLRFRYLHMNPKALDEDRFFSGRPVIQGQIIGKVANFSGREAGTSYHLHFDMQVPTKDGWVWVNPYLTLISAYERLIGGRGSEMQDDPGQASAAEASETVGVPPEYRATRKNLRKSPRKKRVSARLERRS
jgi:hypothetical protein